MKKFIFAVLGALSSIGIAAGQGNSCPLIVQQALNAANSACQDTGRNQACYGNIALQATAVEGKSFVFEQTGDLIDVSDIQSLDVSPMNQEAGTWGVVLMRLQANLPETMVGQNVTFLLFGDVSISPNPNVEAQSPMQAFYLRTGIGDAPCEEAPQSGLMIQTPEGAQQVAFNVNGVDISMGSTILFRAQPGVEMAVSALEGAATVNINNELFPIVAGTWARMPIDSNFNILDVPALPTPYRGEVLSSLPIGLLERDIIPRIPLSEIELQMVYERIQNGALPCGDAEGVLPDCSHLPIININDPNAARFASESWNPPLPNGLRLIPLDDGARCIFKPQESTTQVPDIGIPLCDELFTPEQLEETFNDLNINLLPSLGLPLNTLPCVFPPQPGDPSLCGTNPLGGNGEGLPIPSIPTPGG
jgi:hypothetical protein